MSYVIEMLGIRKEFPGIVANDDITLQVEEGEIHAILGENGAGKSTLMSILFGLYHADKGIIKVRGKEVHIKNPNDAFDLGIGMVHQHFQLVHNFTVAENIIMGKEGGFVYDIRKASRKIKEISERYGLSIEPDMVIEDITVGMQQRVEILKMLYRDADILIFDEPTAVLTPQEIDELMEVGRFSLDHDCHFFCNMVNGEPHLSELESLLMNEDNLMKLRSEFEELHRLAVSKGLRAFLPDHVGTVHIPAYETDDLMLKTTGQGRCNRFQSELCIHYDGTVTPCGMFNPYIYGNVMDYTRESLLESERYRLFQKNQANDDYCKNCGCMLVQEL